MYYLFTATGYGKHTQYTITTDSGWYGWNLKLNSLLTAVIKDKKSIRVLPNGSKSLTEFYLDACNNNPEYTINYLPIGNKLDDLQTTHPELFI